MPELAEVFRRYGAAYRAASPRPLLPEQRAAMRDIQACRTPALGGSLFTCPSCHDSLLYSYHSCGNRACPKCGNDHASHWLDQQRALLLPTDYFLITFTLPQECRALAQSRQKQVYSAFFRAAAHALIHLARNPKYLGGLPGMVGVLHTWRRDLAYHVHLHFIVPAGALSPRRDRWISHRYQDWFLPHKALAARVKLRFKAELHSLHLLHLVNPRVWSRRTSWVVHCKPVRSGQHALTYLAPYVYRVALSNHRILTIDNDQISFRFKDSDSRAWTSTSLPALDFIHRFLLHVLPKGLVKVRYYGFLAPKLRAHLLPCIRALIPPGLGVARAHASPLSSSSRTPRPHRCPACGALMINVQRLFPLPPQRAPP